MLRVAQIIKATSIAGAERHLLTLLAGLRLRQIAPHVLLLLEADTPMQDYIQAIEALTIPVHPLIIRGNMDPTLVYRLRQRLRLIKPQIVHTHLYHADLYGIPAARWAQVPVVISSRHNDNAFRRRQPHKSIIQGLWRITSAGIAISDSIAHFAAEVEGAPVHKLHTIHYGLDFTRQRPEAQQAARKTMRDSLNIDADTPVAGMVCRLVEQKGISDGLKAFAQLHQQLPDALLVITGDGPLRNSLEEEARALNLGEQVRFLGWREDVDQLMPGFDLLFVSSLWEGFGLVILEAMAQQLPVVATAVSAIPEIVVDGETGLLAPPRDVDAMAAALHTLLTDRPLRRHMGQNAEDRLDAHFSARRMVNETVALYKALI